MTSVTWRFNQTNGGLERLRFDFLLTADVIKCEEHVVVFRQLCGELHFDFFIEVRSSEAQKSIVQQTLKDSKQKNNILY